MPKLFLFKITIFSDESTLKLKISELTGLKGLCFSGKRYKCLDLVLGYFQNMWAQQVAPTLRNLYLRFPNPAGLPRNRYKLTNEKSTPPPPLFKK